MDSVLKDRPMTTPERELNEILVKHGYLDNGDLVRTMLPDLLAWRNKRDKGLEERLERLCEWRGITESTRQEIIDTVLKAIREPEVCEKCGRELP
jgi:hypothetical protein